MNRVDRRKLIVEGSFLAIASAIPALHVQSPRLRKGKPVTERRLVPLTSIRRTQTDGATVFYREGALLARGPAR
ncbi:MAG TPA: hypothetical protein VK813_04360 [Edaphobacter sp.]|jgi:hypothetical protein|nr:hypothetical protein [Edaphobacter sp.]